MTQNKDELLVKFLQHFFEPTNNKRKNSGNELEYISDTLNRVFKQNFGLSLTPSEVHQAFERCEFEIFYRNAEYDTESKKITPKIDGQIDTKVSGRIGDEIYAGSPYTFFNIKPSVVRVLKRTTATLPKSTSEEKLKEVNEMREKIKFFDELFI